MPPSPSVIILVADGARPDTLDAAMRAGELPALRRLGEDGDFRTITTAFPSVTGPAYAPFLTGRHPGSVGLPGLRWFDRARTACSWPSYARSYVGAEMRHVDRDLDPESQTMFELAESRIGALSVITRGLATHERIGRGAAFVARTALTHFRGNVHGWLAIDRDISDIVARRVRAEQPQFAFAAFTGIDKTSHSVGHDAPIVHDAMRIVDDAVARIRSDAERDGRWEAMHLWVVSDHGHSRVERHDDLARAIESCGYRVLAHPIVMTPVPSVAVMVSGNAMAHVYVDLRRRTRPFWPRLANRWDSLVRTLLGRDSVDLLLLPRSTHECEIHARDRGMAVARWTAEPGAACYSYTPITGDPLGIGTHDSLSEDASYDATIASDYPDALVQIARITACARSGDIILSAAREWDFRARYEPIPHMSSHGALHREHMLVPLLTNRRIAATARRTVDVMPSACAALGITPRPTEGVSFLVP